MNVKKELRVNKYSAVEDPAKISGQLAPVFIEHYIVAILKKTCLLKHFNRRKSYSCS